ncbi:MAG: TnpV protein [Selenomonadaceae bacterium]|nr:TnpV protein [Selenomonadaceae bacterium]
MEEKFCGVWGHLREEYLKANQPALYELMLEKNELDEYLTGYQAAYSNRAEKMAEKLAAERGVDDNLYKDDSLEWILAYEKIQEEVQSTLREEIQR